MSPRESEFCIFIPTYNEIKNIEEIHRRIRAEFPLIDILFIDDGSPDGTGAKLDEIAKADGRITVLHREGKRGSALHTKQHLSGLMKTVWSCC
jgi:dolichol-phosphate mannosyltransferase